MTIEVGLLLKNFQLYNVYFIVFDNDTSSDDITRVDMRSIPATGGHYLLRFDHLSR